MHNTDLNVASSPHLEVLLSRMTRCHDRWAPQLSVLAVVFLTFLHTRALPACGSPCGTHWPIPDMPVRTSAVSSDALLYQCIFLLFLILYPFFSSASPHSQSISSDTFSSRLATSPGLFALCPQPSSSHGQAHTAGPVACSCCLLLTRSWGSHLSWFWKAPSLRPAFCNVEASSANSMQQEKLFMPFGNLIIGAGSDQLPGKEFPRTSSQRGKKRKHISDVHRWFPYL